MPNYAPLIAKWPTVPGATEAEKLANLNAEMVTGTVPALFFTTGAALWNCTKWAEYDALADGKKIEWREICAISGQIQGGSASPFFAGYVPATWPLAGPTVAALTALAKATPTPWWQANGYMAPINHNDLVAAGLA